MTRRLPAWATPSAPNLDAALAAQRDRSRHDALAAFRQRTRPWNATQLAEARAAAQGVRHD